MKKTETFKRYDKVVVSLVPTKRTGVIARTVEEGIAMKVIREGEGEQSILLIEFTSPCELGWGREDAPNQVPKDYVPISTGKYYNVPKAIVELEEQFNDQPNTSSIYLFPDIYKL